MDADNNIDYIVDFIINDSFSKDLKNKDIKDINDVELNKESNKLLITGSAGTGKTTLIINVLYKLVALQLLESFKLINIKILCLAMTHKALSIIKKYYKKHKDLESPNINITFSTIASFRNLRLDIETNKYLQVEQIKNDYYDVIIIDECSMVDNESYNDFNLYYKGKIIYIGDIHQLPPINQDESQAFQIINKINLDFTYRFGGDILHYANNILEPNFNIDKCYDTENITFFDNLEEFNNKILYYYNNYKDDFIVLTYNNQHNQSSFSVLNLNKMITNDKKTVDIGDNFMFYSNEESKYNSSIIKIISFEEKEMSIVFPNKVYKKMNIKRTEENNVNMIIKYYKCCGIIRDSEQYYNLNITFDAKYHDKLNYFRINELWKLYYKLRDEYVHDVLYAYSATIHKSQGSSYKNVFICLNNIKSAYISIDEKRKLYYTAVTRSSDKLFILK